jgi:hypothetical protein
LFETEPPELSLLMGLSADLQLFDPQFAGRYIDGLQATVDAELQ